MNARANVAFTTPFTEKILYSCSNVIHAECNFSDQERKLILRGPQTITNMSVHIVTQKDSHKGWVSKCVRSTNSTPVAH